MLPEVIAGIILAALIVYALLGGADFGGGVWDLLARGPRAEDQRGIIAGAIGPIWEANHVWMIVAVVLLFTAFPLAFFVIMTALHIPLTLMLVGIVLRGSSFVFRKLDPEGEGGPGAWQRVFAISSIITPFMLGIALGAISTGAIGLENGVVTGGFVAPWLAVFPVVVGLFTLALFAFLAAVYLTLETRDLGLREDFRARGLGSGVILAVIGAWVAVLAIGDAPEVSRHLAGTPAGWAITFGGGFALLVSMSGLWARRYGVARVAAGVVVVLVLLGWGWGMYPWLVAGAVTIEEAAAPRVTLKLVAWILGLGSFLLVPAYAYLVLTFKRGVLFADRLEGGPGENPT
jgi:cytochrome d ubiquinol oxidase subunit II